MAEAPRPNFSVMKLENGWFWTSRAMQDVHGTETMVGPFPSQEEAEKDARETLGIREESNDRSGKV
jgi:hypothetical protein